MILQGGKLKGNRISYEALQTKVYAIFSLKTRAQMSCVHPLSSGSSAKNGEDPTYKSISIKGHEYFNIWPIIDFMCSFQFKKLWDED